MRLPSVIPSRQDPVLVGMDEEWDYLGVREVIRETN
jgi:hypothetical protein